MECTAIEEYCRVREVNHYQCGFLIHPDAPWMGSSPDGMVYDPKSQPVFGLVEVKCPNVASYVDCPYIVLRDGTPTLRKTHPYFWQIQGQMLISGYLSLLVTGLPQPRLLEVGIGHGLGDLHTRYVDLGVGGDDKLLVGPTQGDSVQGKRT
ncbi:hypothetical protein N1851_004644 [Merluccius polli]|uniref:YqaJ viral recombinase domain-containing protein n=1 Tax=Merluccius polli TaxID=89951 RepID=A0AA47N6Z1_MERPO|nr:hypothetical protein N1851_004644 [Merluccius polli]